MFRYPPWYIMVWNILYGIAEDLFGYALILIPGALWVYCVLDLAKGS